MSAVGFLLGMLLGGTSAPGDLTPLDARRALRAELAASKAAARAPREGSLQLARPLARGQVPTEEHLAPLADGARAKLPTAWLGLVARRHLSAGKSLSLADLELPHLVERGQQVTVIARRGALVARMQGRSLSRGRRGERVRVLNEKTGKRLLATVVGVRTVEVTP